MTKNTNSSFKVFIVLIFVLHNTYLADEYIITRKLRDNFEIPFSNCKDDWWSNCTEMNGQATSKRCVCSCNTDNYYNIFGFFENQWKCEGNDVLHNSDSECYFTHLNGRYNQQPLLIVPTTRQLRGTLTFYDTSAFECNLAYNMSYLDCNGVWKQVSQGSSVGFFSTFFTFTWSTKTFNLYDKGSNAFSNYKPTINGYVIKLIVRCEYQNHNTEYCILLKVKGTLNCSINSPPTTSSKPTSTSISTTTVISTLTPSTTPSSDHTTTTSFPPVPKTLITTALPKTQIPSSTPSKLPQDKSASKFGVPTTTTETTKRHNSTKEPLKEGNDDSDISAIIVGPIGGVAALLTIVIVVIFLRARMKRNKRNTSNGVAQNTIYDGVVFDNNSPLPPGQGPSGDDEYSYAYMNTHPIVIKDQNDTVLQVPHVTNGHARNIKTAGPPENSASPIYNTLEDPDYAKLNTAKEAPYNVLERQPEAGWKTPSNSEGTVYNTPESPSNVKINKTNKKQQVGGSSYNVLERGPLAKMNQQNEPFYDALEKQKSTLGLAKTAEGPIYNTLEDPNYTALKRTGDFGDKQSSNGVINESPYYDVLEDPNSTQENPIYNTLEDPNSSQESPVYNVLEGPSTASSPVYAELENPESEGNHVYGALQNYDPHIYGVLNSPTSTNADFDYNDDYNNIGDVIYHNKGAVDSDAYQDLNENGQSSMEEQYEPLRHSNMFIDMKELNGEGQSHA